MTQLTITNEPMAAVYDSPYIKQYIVCIYSRAIENYVCFYVFETAI